MGARRGELCGLTLNGGTLQYAAVLLNATTDITTGTSQNFTLGASGGTIDTNGNTVAYANSIIGAGSLTKSGSGTLTLNGSNSYLGITNVNNGTLEFGVSETLTGGLNVATSGTAVLTAHTGGAANVKVLDITGLTISGTTPSWVAWTRI